MCSQVIVGRSDGTKPMAVLEREITALASQIHSATCRWLGLVAEYDAREGWAVWGCKSCANWVSWQCGIAPGAAREQVRVARRLVELPLIRAAFAEGELSYSKVRALTRVENVEREQDLLDLARHATASQLERLLRAYRGVVAAERAAAGEPPERWITFDHADDGSAAPAWAPARRGGRAPDGGARGRAWSARAAGRSRGNARRRDARRSRGDVGAHGIVVGAFPRRCQGGRDRASDVPAETSGADGRSCGSRRGWRSRGNASAQPCGGAGRRAGRAGGLVPGRRRGSPGPDGRRSLSGRRARRRRDAFGPRAGRAVRARGRLAAGDRDRPAAGVRRLAGSAARTRRAAAADRAQDTHDPAGAAACAALRATAAAASPAAGRGASSTRTTSSTGRTAARPISTT